MRWFRAWRFKRRINRILDEGGWPRGGRSIFKGNVQIAEVRYADGERRLYDGEDF